MDPEVALSMLRAWVERVIEDADNESETEAAQQFAALDGWLSRGGFNPRAWNQPR